MPPKFRGAQIQVLLCSIEVGGTSSGARPSLSSSKNSVYRSVSFNGANDRDNTCSVIWEPALSICVPATVKRCSMRLPDPGARSMSPFSISRFASVPNA